MNKVYILFFFIFITTICYSQTWVERISDNYYSRVSEVTYEYTVITYEQFNRLVQQYRATNDFCRMTFIDVLESRPNGTVISGTRPTFNGYYYILVRKRGELVIDRSNTFLIYGNSNTGRMELEYYNGKPFMYSGDFRVNSNDYVKRWNQFMDWIRHVPQVQREREEQERAVLYDKPGVLSPLVDVSKVLCRVQGVICHLP